MGGGTRFLFNLLCFRILEPHIPELMNNFETCWTPDWEGLNIETTVLNFYRIIVF